MSIGKMDAYMWLSGTNVFDRDIIWWGKWGKRVVVYVYILVEG